MGTVIHSVGIGGTHDYTSLQAWAAALPANLVTDGNAQVAQLYFNGSGDGEFLTTTSFAHVLQLTGHTTNSTNNITVTTGPGQSFRDHVDVRTNPLRYDASKGVGLRTYAGYVNTINIQDDNVIFSNLQMMSDHGNFETISSTGASGTKTVQFNNCIIQNNTNTAVTTVYLFQGFGNAIFRNCVIIHDYLAGAGGGAGVVIGGGSGQIGGEYYFCTFVVPSGLAVSGSTTATACAYGAVTPTVKNCAIFGFANLFTNQPTTYTNCATDLASPPSGVTGSLIYANQFEDITVSGGYDFRPKTGANLINAGVADSINGAFDISGTARPIGAGYDIGAWEYGAAGPAAQAIVATLFKDDLRKLGIPVFR